MIKPLAIKPITLSPIINVNRKGDVMDFTKINNEFMNLQIKLESNEKIIQKLNDYIKKLNKEILKLKNKNEKDELQKSVNILIIGFKESVLKELTMIVLNEENK